MGEKYRKILNAFYREKGLLVDDFCCEQQKECEKVAGQRALSHGAEAHVGSQYGNPFRVVVISLDRGDGSSNIESRSECIEGLVDAKRLNPHMKGTKRLLEATFGDVVTINNIFAHFAMTNSAKCCGADESMDSVPAGIYYNCARFSLDEVAALEADLVITQGKNAFVAFESKDNDVTVSKVPEEKMLNILEIFSVDNSVAINLFKDMVDKYIRIIQWENHQSVLVITPHPSSRAGLWQNFEGVLLDPVMAIARFLAVSGQTQ